MRNLVRGVLAAFTFLLAGGITNLQADGGDMSVGGGLAYATEINTLGIAARGWYEVPSEEYVFYIVPELIYYLPTTSNVNTDLNWWTFDVMGQWLFENSEEFYLYALAGLGVKHQSVTTTSPFLGDVTISDTSLNLDVGAGVEYETDFGGIFGEFRFVFIDGSFLVFESGVRFPI